MKITKSKLKQIIKEELENISEIADVQPGQPVDYDQWSPEERKLAKEGDGGDADMWDVDLERGWATLISDQDPDDFGGDYPSVKIVPVPGSGDRYTLIWGVGAPDYNAVIDEKGDLRPMGRYIPARLIQKVLKRFAAKNEIEP